MNGISRRAFLVASTALAGSFAFAKGGIAQDAKNNLPENPLVVTPTEKVGKLRDSEVGRAPTLLSRSYLLACSISFGVMK